ncbi:MAG: hypothetical protein GX632_08660 [Propioniciclava sp.]|nr:hypothetical protein [Propioniciclava sp.]
MDRDDEVLLVTADGPLRDAVEATAAALGLRVRVVDVDGALARWPSARVVLVGGDRAAALASTGPHRRPHVYLVGFDPVELGTWSMPLGAEVIPLPQGTAWLGGVLAADAGPDSRTVAVVGGSGGVGASTLAAGLALAAVRRGLTCALVDLDPLGGGLDLVLGAERAPGWRWPRLLGARGEVGDVRGVLPVVEGVTVVAMGRGPDEGALTVESVRAVLGSLGRHHGLVLLDPGRVPLPAARQAVRGAEATVLLAGGGVRAVAAAARVAAGLEGTGAGVVVRRAPGGPPVTVVADAVGLPCWGDVPTDRRVAADAEAGEPPWSGRSRWGRAVARVLERVWQEASDVG